MCSINCPRSGARTYHRGAATLASRDKILSLYEADIQVIVRGKAGADVEFGNSLFLAETAEGFIIDHELKRDQSPGDAKWFQKWQILRQPLINGWAEEMRSRLSYILWCFSREMGPLFKTSPFRTGSIYLRRDPLGSSREDYDPALWLVVKQTVPHP